MKRRKKEACILDLVEEKEIDGKLIRIAFFTRPVSEDRPQFAHGTIWGKFTYTRGGFHRLEITIQDEGKIPCSGAIRQASEKFLSELKSRYVGSNVNIDHIMEFVEPKVSDWLASI